MQNKGIVIVLSVLLTLASIFYLSFSVATSYYDSQAAKIKDPVAQQDYKDSVKYLGIYSYKKCLETQIGLGLDLKGGMNVVLEISVPDVVDMLADHKTDAVYRKSMEQAKKEEETSQKDFISLFIKYYRQNAPGHRLAEIFATQQLKGKVSTQSTDAEVEKALRAEVQAAIDNSYIVVRNRIDKFGVVQPNIQKLEGQEGRIMVEMPGIREPERIRKLLQGSANLEFWETYNSEEIVPYLVQLDQMEANVGGDADTTAVEDTAAVAADTAKTAAAKPKFQLKKDDAAAAKTAASSSEAQDELMKKQHPLLSRLQTTGQGALSLVGYAHVRDTAAVNKVIYSETARRILPSDVKLLWSAKPADGLSAKNVFELHALKVTQSNGRAPLEGDVITDARDDFNQMGRPIVSMSMNSDGARRWATLTKANVGRAIAIVLDGAVYSAPRVSNEITGGNSEISGNFTIEDTKDLANTLKSGRMPAPARIVQEDVVGPTLGAQSIQQGLISFVIAFIILMAYMVVLYNFIPGMLANMALLFNLFFTLGIMSSFQTALTMPGIAGLLLSLGMAVDANVLIYERAKEELAKGLNVKKAIDAGYKNAFSAIFDSNLTSIRGFAMTLIIGICCSFFTAIYMTRLIYDRQMKRDKWQGLTFTTGFSRKLPQNTNFNFMGRSKRSLTIWGILTVIFVLSFLFKGFSKSIDFTGGRNYVLRFEKPVQPEQVRDALEGAFGESTFSAIAIGVDGRNIRVTTNYKIESNDQNVDAEVESILFNSLTKAGLVTQTDISKFRNPDIREGGSIISSAKVGPSVAKDITQGAIISVLVAIVAIFLYILLRFRNVAFSLGSTIALAFDTLFVLGIYSLLWGLVPMSLEVDQTFIGAILTVIGYSINDKVVVFDRIRENMGLYTKRDRWTLFNDSLNQTLARTINTGTATLLVLIICFFFAGESIRSFSLTMILGIVFGTFSSIFIAAPVAYLTLGRKERSKGRTAEAK